VKFYCCFPSIAVVASVTDAVHFQVDFLFIIGEIPRKIWSILTLDHGKKVLARKLLRNIN